MRNILTSPRDEDKGDYITRFNRKLARVLDDSKNSESIAEGFDRIFLVVQRLIKYLSKKLNKNVQQAIFKDIVIFVNSLAKNEQFSIPYNTFPNTSVQNYNNKTVGEQFSQLIGLRVWSEDSIPEGGSCRYYTLLLYNFFSKLKEAGLEFKIKFFARKEKSQLDKQLYEHFGLVVTLQGCDYLVDRGDSTAVVGDQTIIKDMKSLVEHNEFFKRNFKDLSIKETEDVVFFDNIEDFIYGLKSCSAGKTMRFYLPIYDQNLDMEDIKFIDFSFTEGGFTVKIDYILYTFHFDVDGISFKFDSKGYSVYYDNSLLKSPIDFLGIITSVTEDKKKREIIQGDVDLLSRILPFIFKRANIRTIDFFPNSEEFIYIRQLDAKKQKKALYVPYKDLSNLDSSATSNS